MIKTKRWLKKALKELKNNLYSWNWESTIGEAQNLLTDYGNATGDRDLDSFTYKFESYDAVEDYIINKVRKDGVYWTAKALESVDGEYDYYQIDDVDGTIYCIDERDVEERLDDMISEL